MAVQIGEIRNEVELTGAASTPAAGRPDGTPPAARQPRWTDRERHRAVAEALARDAARTYSGDRHG
jgi:hypothetical protein